MNPILGSSIINSQSLEDTQVKYISQKYTLVKYTLEKIHFDFFLDFWKNFRYLEKKIFGEQNQIFVENLVKVGETGWILSPKKRKLILL